MPTTKELEKKISSLATGESVEDLESRVQKLEEKSNAEKFDKRVEGITEKYCQMESFKNRVKSVITEQSGQDVYIKRIMEYAGREIDKRRLKSNDKRTTAIVAGGVSLVVTIIGTVLQHFWK